MSLKVKGQGHQGQKRHFSALLAACVRFMFGRTSLASSLVYVGFVVFSEHELTFTFAICYRPSVCRLSVVCLSVVCNVRASYSGGWNFRQYFYGIRYLGHPLTFTKNFTEIIPGEPLRRGSWTQFSWILPSVTPFMALSKWSCSE